MSYKLSPVAHGKWMDTTTTPYTGTTDGQLIYFDVEEAHGISLSGMTRVVFQTSGHYALNLTGAFSQTSGTNVEYDLWMRLNGTNVPYSRKTMSVKDSATIQHLAVAGVKEFSRNDYLEVMWYSSSSNGTLHAEGTAASPTRPSTTAVFMTLKKVSD